MKIYSNKDEMLFDQIPVETVRCRCGNNVNFLGGRHFQDRAYEEMRNEVQMCFSMVSDAFRSLDHDYKFHPYKDEIFRKLCILREKLGYRFPDIRKISGE
jgi:hypothetical protein